MIGINLTVEERFWSNVNVKTPDECWEWKSYAGRNEHAETRVHGKRIAVHRLAYKIAFGNFDESLYVCHKCDNPPCCNPNHLFLGTRQDNVDDRERKRRNKLPHCIGEAHGNAKLTDEQVIEIRREYHEGNTTYRKLSAEYSISFGQIRNVIKGRDWKHLPVNWDKRESIK